MINNFYKIKSKILNIRENEDILTSMYKDIHKEMYGPLGLTILEYDSSDNILLLDIFNHSIIELGYTIDSKFNSIFSSDEEFNRVFDYVEDKIKGMK